MNLLPTYDSLAACESATGIKKSLLSRMRKEGFRAFKSNRVDLSILIIEMADICMHGWDSETKGKEWLDPQQEKARNDKARADKVILEIAQIKKELIPRADIERVESSFLQSIVQAIDQIPSKASPELNPNAPQEAFDILTKHIERAKKIAQGDFKSRMEKPEQETESEE